MHSLCMTALHDLEVKAVHVLTAHVMAPEREKIWTVLGPEFKDNNGKSQSIIQSKLCS